jgi:hypothetical protein
MKYLITLFTAIAAFPVYAVDLLDFGDAPTNYPTLLSANGARHVVDPQGLRLGNLVDTEADGQPVNQDNAVGLADEDGVTFLGGGVLTPGIAAPVRVVVNGGSGLLNGWIDFGGDSNWTADEKVFQNLQVAPGTNVYFVPVPSWATFPSWARFRLSTTSQTVAGAAPDGEVEDYPVTIGPVVPLIFAGLPHEATGDSSLFIQSNKLMVLNLNSNLLNGFRTGFGKVQGYGRTIIVPHVEARSYVSGNFCFGSLHDQTNVPLASTSLHIDGTTKEVWTDMRPLNATSIRVEMFSVSNTFLGSTTVSNLARLQLSRCQGTNDWSITERFSAPSENHVFHNITWAFANANDNSPMCVQVTMPDNQQVGNVARIVCVPQGADVLQPDYLSFTEVSGLTQELGIVSEEVQQQDVWFSSLDGAQFQGGCNGGRELCMSNFGSNGFNGVLMQFNPKELTIDKPVPWMKMMVEPTKLEYPNFFMRLRSVSGTPGGAQDGGLSEVLMERVNADFYQLSSTFAQSGASTISVEIWNAQNTQLVGRTTLPAGLLGTLQGTAQFTSAVCIPTWWGIEFDGPMTFTPPGGSPMTGTTLRCIAANPTNSFDTLRSVSITAANLPSLTITNIAVNRSQFDFGDAPAPGFPTLMGQNGARHPVIPQGLRLGLLVDSETNGQPVDLENASGLADDDGVSFPASIAAGVAAPIQVRVSNGGGYLNGWLDFNQNGQWTTNEQVFNAVYLPPGLHSLTLPVPATAVSGPTWARFRLSSKPNLWFAGAAPDGEVEDYLVTITNQSPVNFGGLPHTVTGEASLIVQSNGLRVLPLQFNSPVTLRTSLGKVQGYARTMIVPHDLGFVEDRTFDDEFSGSLGGTQNVMVASTSMRLNGSFKEMWTDMGSLSATSLRVDFLSSNNEVLSSTTVSNFARLQLSRCQGSNDWRITHRFSAPAEDYVFHTIKWEFANANDNSPMCVQVTLPNNQQVGNVASIIFMPQGSNVLGPDFLSFSEVSGMGMEDVALVAEQVEHEDVWHTALSGVRFQGGCNIPGGDDFCISDFGSSGGDGLRFGAEPLASSYWPVYQDSISLRMDSPIEGSNATVRMAIRQSQNGSETETGFLSIVDEAPQDDFRIEGNFPGMDNLAVEIYNGVTSICSIPVAGGVLADANGVGRPIVLGWATFPNNLRVTFSAPMTFQLPGQQPMVGDRIVLSTSTFAPPQQRQQMELTAANIQPISITNITIVPRPADYGDAPAATFPTMLAQNGARHAAQAQGLRLGTLVDNETNGQPVDLENASGVADDDGITISSITSGTLAPIQIQVSNGGGYLNAWVDFNGNGNWTAGEQIFKDAFFPPGMHVTNIAVPASAVPGNAWARFRLSTRTNLWHNGPAPNGEVEDLLVTITTQTPLNFGGLPHTAVGEASLIMQSNQLRVLNLNSNLPGGFRTSLGKVQGYARTMIVPHLMPIEDIFTIQVGSLNGETNQTLASTGFHTDGYIKEVWTDMRPLSATSLRIDLLSSNDVVLSSTTVSNLARLQLSRCQGNNDWRITERFSAPVPTDSQVYHTIKWEFANANDNSPMCVQVTLPNNQQVGNVARMICVPQGTNVLQPDYLSFTEVSGMGMEDVALVAEEVQQFGFWHRAVNNPTIQGNQFGGQDFEFGGQDLEIVLSNLDSAQGNGIAIDTLEGLLLPAKRLRLQLTPLAFASTPNAELILRAFIRADGTPVAPSLRLVQGTPTHALHCISDGLSNTVFIRGFNNGELVGAVTVDAGLLGSLTGNVVINDFGIIAMPPSFRFGVATPVSLATSGGTINGAKEFLLTLTGPGPSSNRLEAVEMTGLNLPQGINIIGETIAARRPAPQQMLFSPGNTQWSFRLPTDPGTSYSIDYQNSLGSPGWTLLQTVAGTGDTVTIADNTPPQTNRFYRIVAE